MILKCTKNMHIEKIIARYGLVKDKIENIDLQTCYSQNTPNKPISDIFNYNRLMIHSPHFQLAKMYYENGLSKTKKNYIRTDYCRMKEYFGKGSKFPSKIIPLYDSIKRGYLCEGHKEDYIVLLMQSFAISRYNRNEENLVPEVWSGHHRVGALLALGIYHADVLIAKDAHPGEKTSAGKIHRWCKE